MLCPFWSSFPWYCCRCLYLFLSIVARQVPGFKPLCCMALTSGLMFKDAVTDPYSLLTVQLMKRKDSTLTNLNKDLLYLTMLDDHWIKIIQMFQALPTLTIKHEYLRSRAYKCLSLSSPSSSSPSSSSDRFSNFWNVFPLSFHIILESTEKIYV